MKKPSDPSPLRRPAAITQLDFSDVNTDSAILLALARLGPMSTDDVREATGGSAGGTSRHLKTLRESGQIDAADEMVGRDTLDRVRCQRVYRLTEQGVRRVAAIEERLQTITGAERLAAAINLQTASHHHEPD